jgi:hypothetical protein
VGLEGKVEKLAWNQQKGNKKESHEEQGEWHTSKVVNLHWNYMIAEKSNEIKVVDKACLLKCES